MSRALAASSPSADIGGAFWQYVPDALLTRLASKREGLAQEEADARLARDGPNEIGETARLQIFVDLLHRLTNPLVAILLVAAAIAGITGDLASFLIILAVVILSTLLDMVQEHRAQATAAALKRSIALHATVLRDSKPIELPVSAIVAGDVLQLCAGDLVPADGIVLASNGAQVNEALLTGEPYPVEKRVGPDPEASTPAEASGALFHGTSVIAGTATMLVVETGARTRFGAIAQSLAAAPTPTAFERGIHKLGMLIARLTIFLVLFVLLAHLALGRPPLQSFLFSMALAVGLTPELLPMIMTVSLARGARRMASAKVVVKRLSAIHDLGEMDVLCTDKTGTLTEARITLVGHPGIDGDDDDRVAELAAINAQFETGLKSPLDEALITHMTGRSLDGWTKLDERPFDFERRRVSVLAEREGERIEIVKGAPETMLALCRHARDRSGDLVAIDEGLRARLIQLHDERAAQGLRLLGIAWKPAPDQERIGDADEDGLVFAGYCVFIDPPKASAAEAVARLETAGIRIKVISGDAGAVVEHLVASLALPVEGLLTGEEIGKLNDAALAARVDTVDLFVRVTPDQKVRVVRALRARGHTVGFMGDGINDAPAIHAADVGLSVDGATDVAREAADMILLAPDLGVLADGVAEGRRTYANIMKYIRMGTSSNFGNMLTMALASLVLPFLPLTAVQVLLNNLIYDLSQIGIPFDSADASDLAGPRGWDMPGLVRFTAIMGPLSSLFDIATFVLLLEVFHVDVATFRSAWFIESMATQILVVFIIRTARPAWTSRAHIVLVVTALGGLLTALTLPFLPLASFLDFAPPSGMVLGAIALLVAAYLAISEGTKRFALRPAP
ncbi:cation-transporting ATPase [Sphingobium sp. C100]|uniref:magnesium-translocating P-type ATPase n=1 Tax=Sphingobium sp. C100 TaxID=1207055 RepID=UPI0003D6586E|nr:magnesium-translocating P-type ATPase [Sphingobium sp. C100]ETI64540.1 cation-transporting ATPase [Sphingobium sp. C100]